MKLHIAAALALPAVLAFAAPAGAAEGERKQVTVLFAELLKAKVQFVHLLCQCLQSHVFSSHIARLKTFHQVREEVR